MIMQTHPDIRPDRNSMTALKTNLTDAMGIAASQAGLKLVSTTEGKDFQDRKSTR